MLSFLTLTTESIIMKFCIHVFKETKKSLGSFYPRKQLGMALSAMQTKIHIYLYDIVTLSDFFSTMNNDNQQSIAVRGWRQLNCSFLFYIAIKQSVPKDKNNTIQKQLRSLNTYMQFTRVSAIGYT